MKKLFLLLTLFMAVFATSAKADYITIPAGGITIGGDDFSECYYDGTTITHTGSDSCGFYFPIEIPAGKTLSTVTLYYYDNSGSQTFYASIYKFSLTSTTSSGTEIDTVYDTSKSSSVQYYSFSVGSTTSSSYVYYVLVSMAQETRFQGAKVYYY